MLFPGGVVSANGAWGYFIVKNILNHIGKKFNKLTVIDYGGTYTSKGWRIHQLLCRCECGTEKLFTYNFVVIGKIAHCGCSFDKEVAYRKKIKTGYMLYRGMLSRCYNKKTPNYNDYGGRGIFVCERWRRSFKNFYEDMGERPSKRYSLDRINNNDGYYKENCRWATSKEQAKNKRPNKNEKIYTHQDKTMNLYKWATHFKVNPHTLYSLVKKRGFEEAIKHILKNS